MKVNLSFFQNCILSIGLILFFTALGLGQGVWRSIGPDGGTVRTLAIDPTDSMTLYAVSSGGVFKSTDGGANWSPINNGLPNFFVSALVIDPISPMTLYAGTSRGLFIGVVPTSGGVFKSTDGGGQLEPHQQRLANPFWCQRPGD